MKRVALVVLIVLLVFSSGCCTGALKFIRDLTPRDNTQKPYSPPDGVIETTVPTGGNYYFDPIIEDERDFNNCLNVWSHNQTERDLCYDRWAYMTNQSHYCSYIVHKAIYNGCYLGLAQTLRDESLCNNLHVNPEEYLENTILSCYLYVFDARDDVGVCENAIDVYIDAWGDTLKSLCYESIIFGRGGDKNLCDKVSEPAECYWRYAKENLDSTVCPKTPDYIICYMHLAEELDDLSLCANIDIPDQLAMCEGDYAAIT